LPRCKTPAWHTAVDTKSDTKSDAKRKNGENGLFMEVTPIATGRDASTKALKNLALIAAKIT
jgi:hypothetical protein